MLRLFFSLPPIGYFIIAALLVAAGNFVQNVDNKTQAERAQALEGQPPELVALGDFTRADIGLANEVNIAAQINTEYTYTLYKGSERDSSARVLWLLFDPEATGNERSVQAAIMVRQRDADTFTEWLLNNVSEMGDISPIFHINGIRKTVVPYDEVADDAISDENLIKKANFFYIEPFVNGRAAGLAPRSGNDNSLLHLAIVAALLVAAIVVLKTLWRRRRRTV